MRLKRLLPVLLIISVLLPNVSFINAIGGSYDGGPTNSSDEIVEEKKVKNSSTYKSEEIDITEIIQKLNKLKHIYPLPGYAPVPENSDVIIGELEKKIIDGLKEKAEKNKKTGEYYTRSLFTENLDLLFQYYYYLSKDASGKEPALIIERLTYSDVDDLNKMTEFEELLDEQDKSVKRFSLGNFDIYSLPKFTFFNVKGYLGLLRVGYFTSARVPEVVSASATANGIKTPDGFDEQIKLMVHKMGDVVNFIKSRKDVEAFNPILKPYTDKLPGMEFSLEDLAKETSKPLTTPDGVESPISVFYNKQTQNVSENILKGIALSATYMPMVTDLDNKETFSLLEEDVAWKVFNEKFGGMRKMLVYEESASSASKYFTNPRNTARKKLTLDILFGTDNIVAYPERGFYNEDKLELKPLLSYNKKGGAKNSEGKVEEIVDQLAITSIVDTPISKLLQTPFNIDQVTLGEFWNKNPDNEYSRIVLPMDSCILALKGVKREDSAVNGYAVISSMIRDPEVFKQIAKEESLPVFLSASDIHKNINLYSSSNIAPQKLHILRNARYNNTLLKNLKDSYVSNPSLLALRNMPLYIDIYGNISAENGVVIIPAAANGTISFEEYNPYTVAFLSKYKDSELLYDDKSVYVYKSFKEQIKVDEETGIEKKVLVVDEKLFDAFETATVNVMNRDAALSLYKYTLGTLKEQVKTMRQKPYHFKSVTLSVLTGAKVREIKPREKFNYVNPKSIATAVTIEKTVDALGLDSSIGFSVVPELTDKNIGVIVVIIYRVLLAITMVITLVLVMRHLHTGTMGFVTFYKLLAFPALAILMVIAIPVVMFQTHERINSLAVSGFTEDMLYSLVNTSSNGMYRTMNGVKDAREELKDLGITLTSLKYNPLKLIILASSAKDVESLDAIKEVVAEVNPIVGFDDSITVKSNKVQVGVLQMLDSTKLVYDKNDTRIKMYLTSEPVASFYLPYYYILDSLVQQLNLYNHKYWAKQGALVTNPDGSLITKGFIKRFVTSKEFNESLDITGLRSAYGLSNEFSYSGETLNRLQGQDWFQAAASPEDIESVIERLEEDVRNYVVLNSKKIGNTRDDVFLKMIALRAALRYNRMIGSEASIIDVQNLKPTDIIKASIFTHDQLNRTSEFSPIRSFYEEGGLVLVVSGVLASMVTVLKNLMSIITLYVIVFAVLASITMWSAFGFTKEALYTIAMSIVKLGGAILLNASFLFMNLQIGAFNGVTNPYIKLLLYFIAQVIVLVIYSTIVYKILKEVVEDAKLNNGQLLNVFGFKANIEANTFMEDDVLTSIRKNDQYKNG